MKHLPLKIWLLATVTPVFVAVIIRMVWEVVIIPSTGGLVMTVLVILGLLGLYALVAYFIFKPDLKKLVNLPVRIAFIVMATGGIIGGVIHLTRFVPSPEVGLPWSIVIAALYLIAGMSAYFMLLWAVWTVWKSRKNQR